MFKTFFLFFFIAFAKADVYENCKKGENCFAIPFFESDFDTCVAQKVNIFLDKNDAE